MYRENNKQKYEEKTTSSIREKVSGIRNNLEEISKEKRDKEIDYKILRTKASSHFGAHIMGPLMELYYKKFTDYVPEKYRNSSEK